MNNFIFIDGIAFWIIFIILIFWFFVFIALGNGYIKSQREIEYKNKQLKNLRKEYNRLIGEYHRVTFKVPEIDLENKNGRKDTKTDAAR